jgi:type II secretory pathway pseudopilin PulG
MTLLELMIVIMILAIFGTVAMPSFSVNEAVKLNLVELQASNAVDYASYLADVTGQTHGVVFDTASDGFAVVDGDGVPVRDVLNQGDYIITFDRPDQPQGIDITAASFGTNGPAAIFGPDGVAEMGGTLTVQCKSVVTTLALNAATGLLTAQ